MWDALLVGVPDGVSTHDLQSHNLALCQLSYGYHMREDFAPRPFSIARGRTPVKQRPGHTLAVFVVFAVLVHHALAPGVDRRLRPVGQMQLAQDVADVAFDGVLADDQPLRNLGIRAALRD